MGDTHLDRLAALDTNTVSDALDFLELPEATYGLRPLWGCPKIVGRASTVKLGPKIQGAPPTVHLITPVIDAVTTNDRILVIAGGAEGISCWGDIIANAAKVKNIRGSVIDGMSRDIDGSRDIGYPLFGLGVTMISGRNRVVQIDSGTPVEMRGVTVHQDDYVIADNCGTVFVPASRVQEVLDLGERIDSRQKGMVSEVRAGRPVAEVMHDKQFEAIVASSSVTGTGTPGKSQRNPKKASPEDQELVALFADSDTAGVSDALDKLGIPGQAFSIMPLTNYKKTTVGPAFTVRYVPASDPPGSVGDFVDDVPVGYFVVIDNGGRTDCTVWGDIMTQYAGLRGIAGTVIDGVCRDVDRAISDGYPIFTAGRWMRTGKDRVQVGGINESIGVGRVRVGPCDIVVADANGVVIVPRDRAREVAALAKRIEKSEAGIRELISAGATIAEARNKLGYHTLQRKGLLRATSGVANRHPYDLPSRLAGYDKQFCRHAALRPIQTQIVASSGFDAVVVDCEHGHIGDDTMHNSVAAIASQGVSPLVRIQMTHVDLIKRALDAGAQGIVLPMINTAEEARAGSPFPGLALGIDIPTYIKTANETPITSIQIETKMGVENVDAICAVPGVDMIFIGPNDLALSVLGYVPARGDEPEFVEAIKKIVAAARKHGKWVSRLSNDRVLASKHLEVVDTVALGYDVRAIQNWYTAELKAARSGY
ncbi:Phosphoenolpyruvate/pyruvate domain-containing protein [Thozetella sp. PMI_491]|nr:Phosphoenolpyruvate/pyruvate domain-containing protein [Thozetella sp. PMI_491]